jgi:hypothetical protein
MPGKSTRAEIIARVEQVVLLRLNGADLAQVVEYGNQKEWSVGPRMLKKYITAADKKILRQSERNHARNVGLHVARRKRLYCLAMEQQDFKLAHAILKDLGELEAAYPAQAMKLKLETPPAPHFVMSAADREALRTMALRRLAVDLDSPSGPLDAGVKGDTNGHTVEPPAEGGSPAPGVIPPPDAAPPPPEDPEVLQDRPGAKYYAPEQFCNSPPQPLWKATPKQPRRALGGEPPVGSPGYWVCPRCQGRWVQDPAITSMWCPDCQDEPPSQ